MAGAGASGSKQRNSGFEECAGFGAHQAEVAAELANAFAHSVHSYPKAARRRSSSEIARQSLPEIANADQNPVGLLFDFYARGLWWRRGGTRW